MSAAICGSDVAGAMSMQKTRISLRSSGLRSLRPRIGFQYTQRMTTLPIRDFTVSVARKTQARTVFKES